MKNNTFYITTAIDYVNALPHLGTAYEKIGADVIARYYRYNDYQVRLMMGVDEHSLNVEKEAIRRKLPVKVYCDQMKDQFEQVWKNLNIQYDKFIQTSSKEHVSVVQDFFQTIYDRGDIYKGEYEGHYCGSCENFILEKELIDGNCPTHHTQPEYIKEENYFFRLSKYQKALLDWYDSHPEFIQPMTRYNEIRNLVEGGLQDISVTRKNIAWGVPVPFDEQYVVYVWFDALINYISGLGYAEKKDLFDRYWPANIHVIGKDITRFHCVIWPAMLMCLGLDIPKQVWGHGFVYLKGEKMSKTRGTVVSPSDVAKERGVDALRYYLMREVPFDRDGDFTWEGFYQRYDSDLSNDLGNLVQRVLSMLHRYIDGVIGDQIDLKEGDLNFQVFYNEKYFQYHLEMKKNNLSQALGLIWQCIQKANQYVDDRAPWKLSKDPEKKDELKTVLAILVDAIGFIGLMLQPFIPETAQKILNQIGWKDSNQFVDHLIWNQRKNQTILNPEPLFPKYHTSEKKE